MSGQVSIQVRHNFETAHRLPFLGGKCTNLHGHSWWATVNILYYGHETGMDGNGISADYGSVKKIVRQFIDSTLDHGTMLGVDDPLVGPLMDENCKVFLFGEKGDWEVMPWPSVEAVARMIAENIQLELDESKPNSKLWVDSVKIQETDVNYALWVPTIDR